MSLIKEKEENKKKIILAIVIAFITLLSSFSLFVTSGLAEIPTVVRIVLIAVGFVVLILGIGVCCVLEQGAGAYECKHCGELFVPSMKAYIMAPHTITTRRLRCPSCGKKSYCRKRLATDKHE